MPASSQTRSDLGLRIRVAPEEVTYRHWPLLRTGWGGWLTFSLLIFAPVVVAWAAASIAMGALALGCLLWVSWRAWFPMEVTVGPAGVTQRLLGRRRLIPWTAIRRYEVGLHGVLLLPDATVNSFSALRGIYLYWGNRRAEVLANFEYYLQSWSAPRDTGNESTDLAQPVP